MRSDIEICENFLSQIKRALKFLERVRKRNDKRIKKNDVIFKCNSVNDTQWDNNV